MSKTKRALLNELAGIFGEVQAERLALRTVAGKRVQPWKLQAMTAAEIIACEAAPFQMLAGMMGLESDEVAQIVADGHGVLSGVVGLERCMGRLALAIVGGMLSSADAAIYGPVFDDSNRDAALSYAAGGRSRGAAGRYAVAAGLCVSA